MIRRRVETTTRCSMRAMIAPLIAVAPLMLAVVPSAVVAFPAHHSATGPSIGPTTGPSIGATTGPSLGVATGPSIGATVGPSIGPSVGPSIGSPSAEHAAHAARHLPGSREAHRAAVRPFVFFGAPVVAYPSPFVDAPAEAYDNRPSPPVVYAPPAYASPASVSIAPPPPAAPLRPSVIEYPDGRYELRGDGVTTPYTWVWIPNPPPGPPVPQMPPPARDTRSPERYMRVYQWTDEQGILHVTDRRDAVPEKFRDD